MDELLFNLLDLVVMIAVILVTRYIIPTAKNLIGEQRMNQVILWTDTAVRFAQQTMSASTGSEKKAVVSEYLTKLCTDKGITLTDDQIDKLIESAVLTMNMELHKTKEESAA